MSTSSSPSPDSPPPDDRLQREIDDIIRLAEKRLERQDRKSKGAPRKKRRSSGFQPGRALQGLNFRIPDPQTLAGWGIALMLIGWLGSFLGLRIISVPATVIGITLLAAGLILSLTGRTSSGGEKTWRGERISYGNPYGGDFFERIKRMFRR